MPRKTVRAKLSALAIVIVLFIAYYLFLFDLLVIVKDSVVNYLVNAGLTSITIPVKKYDAAQGTWVDTPYSFDLSGFIDLTLTIAIILAPFLFAFETLLD